LEVTSLKVATLDAVSLKAFSLEFICLGQAKVHTNLCDGGGAR
jgi:hypothetical protein